MVTYSSFEQPFQYSDDDRYIRAIRFNMIRRNGEIKISAFKSNKGGVSVTRTNTALFDRAMAYMLLHFEGVMGHFPVSICRQNSIYEEYSPSSGHNIHHWELYGNDEHQELSLDQITAIMRELVV